MIDIIELYNFNGIDIDIETNSNVQVDPVYFEKSIIAISDYYASNLMFTIDSSCTEMRTENSQAGHSEQVYHKCASVLKDICSIISTRYYNSGSQIGDDFPIVWSRTQGTVSFITSQVVKQLKDDSLNNNTIGMTILSYNCSDAYLEPEKIILALRSIMEGIDPQDTVKNFIPDKAYPNFCAVTLWTINCDAYYNYNMSNTIKDYFENL